MRKQRKEARRGVIPQRQEGYASLRMPTWGRVTSDQLRAIGKTAAKEGRGYALLTMRKGVEIPWVKSARIEDAARELGRTGLRPGSSDDEVRVVMSCAGQDRCPFDRIDVDRLAQQIGERYYARAMPKKFTITLSGCPNYCSHPYLNDVGIVGRTRPTIDADKCIGCGQCVRLCRGDASGALEQVGTDAPSIDYEKCIECGWCIANCPTGAMAAEKHGCTILVGGRGGTDPRLATEVVRIASEDETLAILENIFRYMREHAREGERLVDVIERLGLEHFREQVLSEVIAEVEE